MLLIFFFLDLKYWLQSGVLRARQWGSTAFPCFSQMHYLRYSSERTWIDLWEWPESLVRNVGCTSFHAFAAHSNQGEVPGVEI